MASVAAASGQATAGGWRTPERFVAWQLVAFISEAMSAHGPERRLLRDSITSGIGVKAEVSGRRSNDVNDPSRHFATV